MDTVNHQKESSHLIEYDGHRSSRYFAATAAMEGALALRYPVTGPWYPKAFARLVVLHRMSLTLVLFEFSSPLQVSHTLKKLSARFVQRTACARV